MLKPVAAALAATAIASMAPAAADLENYFFCKANDGVSQADIVAFKTEYENAVIAAGFEGYNLKVIFPIYSEKRGDGAFYWYGSFKDFNQLQSVSEWFYASEWTARWPEVMTCGESSLWNAFD